MPDPSDRDPEADRRASRQGFLWAFGLCAGLPPVVALAASLLPIGGLAVAAVLGPPVLWAFALLASLVLVLVDRRRGLSALIGVLAGVIVGFSLCSGALSITNAL